MYYTSERLLNFDGRRFELQLRPPDIKRQWATNSYTTRHGCVDISTFCRFSYIDDVWVADDTEQILTDLDANIKVKFLGFCAAQLK